MSTKRRLSLALSGALLTAGAFALLSLTHDPVDDVVPGPDSSPNLSGRPNIVFVVIDTLRADRLATYGADHDAAPFLSELAERSVVFDNAMSASSWTSSASASFFTSTYPDQHQVLTGYFIARRNGKDGDRRFRPNRIPDALPTLPEVLSAHGYQTFGVADNLNICETMGFARGFDHFEHFEYAGAPRVNEVAEGYLPELERGAAPFFLYVHYMDPHKPYNRWDAHVDERASGSLFAAYDSEIGYVDAHLRALFEMLPMDDDTLVIVTSDHGEEFGEHGRFGHRNQLYAELVHVPLLVSWPARLPAHRAQGVASTVDLLPTLESIVGAELAPHQVGVDLAPMLLGDDQANRAVLAMRWNEVRRPALVRRAVIDERWKYIWSMPRNRRELYDRRVDSTEQDDVASEHPEVIEALHEVLTRHEQSATTFERSHAESRELDGALLERLRALGYAH